MKEEISKYNFEQKRSDYLTPPCVISKIFDLLKELNIDCDNIFSLDTCCSKNNIPARFRYYEKQFDGLLMNWFGISYCNPPYKECGKWVKKAYSEFKKGVICVLLIPARTETAYWHKYLLEDGMINKRNIYIKFLRKGLKFLNPDDDSEMGVFKNSLAIVVMNGENEVKYDR